MPTIPGVHQSLNASAGTFKFGAELSRIRSKAMPLILATLVMPVKAHEAIAELLAVKRKPAFES